MSERIQPVLRGDILEWHQYCGIVRRCLSFSSKSYSKSDNYQWTQNSLLVTQTCLRDPCIEASEGRHIRRNKGGRREWRTEIGLQMWSGICHGPNWHSRETGVGLKPSHDSPEDHRGKNNIQARGAAPIAGNQVTGRRRGIAVWYPWARSHHK